MAEVEFIALDGEDFGPAERAELLRALEEGAESIQRGDFVDGIDFATQLLVRRADQTR
jgi:hypothetical protein